MQRKRGWVLLDLQSPLPTFPSAGLQSGAQPGHPPPETSSPCQGTGAGAAWDSPGALKLGSSLAAGGEGELLLLGRGCSGGAGLSPARWPGISTADARAGKVTLLCVRESHRLGFNSSAGWESWSKGRTLLWLSIPRLAASVLDLGNFLSLSV